MSVEVEKEFISKISFKKRLLLGLMGLFVGILLLIVIIGIVLIVNSLILIFGMQVKEKIRFSKNGIKFKRGKFISSRSEITDLPINQIVAISTVFYNSRNLSYLKFETSDNKIHKFTFNAGFSNDDRKEILEFTQNYVQQFPNIKLTNEKIVRRVVTS